MSSSKIRSSGTSLSLLARVRADDAGAWNRLVTLYAPLVFHWCRRAQLQEHDIEDVFQEVFQAVLTHIRDFRKERRGDTFRGWLYTITRNKIRDYHRRAQREPHGEGGTEAMQRFSQLEAPASRTEDVDLSSAALATKAAAADGVADDADVERALYHRALGMIRGEFHERTWKAFWRTAVEDRSASDVAAGLGMSPGAVRVAKSRVLRRLPEETGNAL